MAEKVTLVRVGRVLLGRGSDNRTGSEETEYLREGRIADVTAVHFSQYMTFFQDVLQLRWSQESTS